MNDRPCILFLCTHNAARSQMAEALLRRHGGGRFRACSAGTEPTEVDPLTRRVLGEIEVDSRDLRAKGFREFLGREPVSYAIVVCERTEDICPHVYPFALRMLHWPFPDPAAVHGSSELRLAKFRRVRDEIDARIRSWLRDVGTPDREE